MELLKHNIPYTLAIFCTHWKVSEYSGRFPECPTILWILQKLSRMPLLFSVLEHFSEGLKNFKTIWKALRVFVNCPETLECPQRRFGSVLFCSKVYCIQFSNDTVVKQYSIAMAQHYSAPYLIEISSSHVTRLYNYPVVPTV